MESPISLVKNDNVQAKWAWMAGFQFAYDLCVNKYTFELGSLFEYARIEPFVYSHFRENSAQIANLERPLGNQSGPNSQTIDWLLYSRFEQRIVFGIHNHWLWKGTDFGSDINDATPNLHIAEKKSFLRGAELEYSVTPFLSYEGCYTNFVLEWTFINDKKVFSRIGFKW